MKYEVLVEYDTGKTVCGEPQYKLKSVQVNEIEELNQILGEGKYFIIDLESINETPD